MIVRENCGWTFDYLPELMITNNIPAKTIVHVGSHLGEEVHIYKYCEFEKIILIEPNPGLLAKLHVKFDNDPKIEILPIAVGTEPGVATFYLQDRSDWSGLDESLSRAPGHNLGVSLGPSVPVPVTAITMLELQRSYNPNVLVLDTQGLEAALLRQTDLQPLDLIIVECSNRPGDSAAPYSATVQYMESQKWSVIELWQQDHYSGYFDVVFGKTN